MFCEKCGTKLPEDGAFCPACGTMYTPPQEEAVPAPEVPAVDPVVEEVPGAEAAPAVEQLPIEEEIPAAPPAPVPAPAAEAPVNKVPKRMTFICFGLAILFFILAFAAFTLPPKGDEELLAWDMAGAWECDLKVNIRSEFGGRMKEKFSLLLLAEPVDDSTLLLFVADFSTRDKELTAEVLDGETAFFARLQEGVLYFYYPSDDVDTVLRVPIKNMSGECEAEVDSNSWRGSISCEMRAWGN